MSGGIETSQLGPLDADANRERRAAITCAAHILEAHPGVHPEHPGPEVRHELLELLRALGLTHDPLALDRDPIDTSHARPRGPAQ